MAYRNPADQKAAARRHYEANRAAMIARAKEAKRRTAERIRAELNRHKSVPCVDCAASYPPYVMQFDHIRGPKLFNVADTRKWTSYERVMTEVGKCEVACANCHAERTYRRAHLAG